MAQVSQRCLGAPKRLTQVSQIGGAGQQWQTAQTPPTRSSAGDTEASSARNMRVNILRAPNPSHLMQASRPLIDPRAAARWAALPPRRDAQGRPVSPWLHEEIGRRMAERLPWITVKPRAWAHWGPLAGGLKAHGAVEQLVGRVPVHLVESDPTRLRLAVKELGGPWWSPANWGGGRLRGEPEAGSVDMVWANMLLHQTADPKALLQRWHRALAVDGYLMFSCLGPDTLSELRALYAGAGWPPPMSAFTDMHDWGDLLVETGFAEPVMDMETVQLSFETPARLVAELRELGRNLHPQRHAGLRGRRWREVLYAQMAAHLARPTEQGRLVVRFEIVYGHAFKAPQRHPVAPVSAIGVEEMRTTLRERKKNLRNL